MRQFSGTCAFQMVAPDLGPVQQVPHGASIHITHTFGKGEKLPRKRWVFGGSMLATVAVASVIAVNAIGAGGSPADKVVAAGDKEQVMAPQTGATLLTATMSTSKPTDLILNVNAECSILTTLDNVGTSTATASGQVRIWVEVDNQIVPVQSMSSPPQNTPPGGDDTDKAVFCEREHQVNFMPTTQ